MVITVDHAMERFVTCATQKVVHMYGSICLHSLLFHTLSPLSITFFSPPSPDVSFPTHSPLLFAGVFVMWFGLILRQEIISSQNKID